MTAKPEPLARTDPGSADAPASASGPTAIVHGPARFESTPPGREGGSAFLRCVGCTKENHEGVSHCVFCGLPLGPKRSSPWIEGPDSDEPPASDPPPSSHRADLLSLEEIAVDKPIADPLIGVVVADRYRILEALGRGGMGIVYKVEHTRIGKLLAMKLLTGELSRNPDVVRRFKQEALTVSKLSSPNTVQVFDFGVAEGLTYLVMELVAGEDLGRALRQGGPMPFSRLGKIVVQVCSSLAEAHQKGIVHRDMKPENVMLLRATRDGTDVAKVLDFGLAKLREGPELNDVTSQGAIVGTPYFMAPEQVRGDSVDARTDIYALGALMYRALSGHYPFNGPTPMAVFTKHLTEEPSPLSEREPDSPIPLGVCRIVHRALAKDPAARWQKVEDLQTALVDELRSQAPVSLDSLLDSNRLRTLAKAATEVEMKSAFGTAAPVVELATRDELVAYERKLRRQRYTAVAFGGVLALGLVGLAVKIALVPAQTEFIGTETEPNNTAAEAQALPFGREVNGFLGRRIDAAHGDRDFFAVDVPKSDRGLSRVHLSLNPLPNFAVCAFLYQQGFTTPLGQYCVGKAGRKLEIPKLSLEPGRYLVAVMQDVDPYGGPPPFLHENVSDPYTLSLGPATGDEKLEVEPNDQFASANTVAEGSSVSGTIGWARDEDVFCIAASHRKIRWKVRDVVRDAGSVLEATILRGGESGAPVRVHVLGKGTTSASDVTNPWESRSVGADESPRCLRVRLVVDPWSTVDVGSVPRGGNEAYVVEVAAVP